MQHCYYFNTNINSWVPALQVEMPTGWAGWRASAAFEVEHHSAEQLGHSVCWATNLEVEATDYSWYNFYANEKYGSPGQDNTFNCVMGVFPGWDWMYVDSWPDFYSPCEYFYYPTW